MVGLYLQRMHPANATEVSTMVRGDSSGKEVVRIQQGGLKLWLQNKGVVNAYM